MVKAVDILLAQTLSQLRKYVYLESPSNDEKKTESPIQIDSGGNNTVQIQHHPVSREFYDPATFLPIGNKESHIKIAVSTTRTPKTLIYKNIAKEENRDAKTTLRLLSSLENKKREKPYNKQSATLFIQHFLYCGKGRKVSLAADNDLYDWIVAHKDDKTFTEEKLKKIIAQILIAVEALHSREIVHRDLKPENFLFHSIHDYIELADLDSINKATNPHLDVPPYTPDYLAPECRTDENKKLSPEMAKINASLYRKVSKKAVDCYAIGYMIESINSTLTSPSISYSHKTILSNLSSGLRDPNPNKRLTIKAAMEHPYFGEDTKTRTDYFNRVQNAYQQPDIFYGGYYYNRKKHFYPEFRDAFFLLPDSIKNLYFQAASLQSQIKLICEGYSLEEIHFIAINKQIGIVKNSLKEIPSLDDNHKELKTILNNLLKCAQKAENLVKFEQQRLNPTPQPTISNMPMGKGATPFWIPKTNHQDATVAGIKFLDKPDQNAPCKQPNKRRLS